MGRRLSDVEEAEKTCLYVLARIGTKDYRARDSSGHLSTRNLSEAQVYYSLAHAIRRKHHGEVALKLEDERKS